MLFHENYDRHARELREAARQTVDLSYSTSTQMAAKYLVQQGNFFQGGSSEQGAWEQIQNYRHRNSAMHRLKEVGL